MCFIRNKTFNVYVLQAEDLAQKINDCGLDRKEVDGMLAPDSDVTCSRTCNRTGNASQSSCKRISQQTTLYWRAHIVSSEPNCESGACFHVQMHQKSAATRWKMATSKSFSMEDGVTVNTDITSGIDNQAFTVL